MNVRELYTYYYRMYRLNKDCMRELTSKSPEINIVRNAMTSYLGVNTKNTYSFKLGIFRYPTFKGTCRKPQN